MNVGSMTRRVALQAALAASLFPGVIGRSGSVAAQDSSGTTWNWDGNAGHTGELPGPGLDLDQPMGELWRVPDYEFWSGGRYDDQFAGYADDIIYTWYEDTLCARRLSDGKFLWWQDAANLLGEAPSATPSATPTSNYPALVGSAPVAIHNGVILVPVNNGRLWGLDAATGALRWDIGGDAFDRRVGGNVPPTIVGDLAFSVSDQGISAVRLTDPPEVQWLAEWEVDGWLLGADSELVYAMTVDWRREIYTIRALAVTDGAEYWRTDLDRELIDYVYTFGITRHGVGLFGGHRDTEEAQVVMIDRTGQVSWSAESGAYASMLGGWFLDESVIRVIRQRAQNDYYFLESIDAASGVLNWTLDIDTYRWYTNYVPVMCAGSAYAFGRDRLNEDSVLLVIDPLSGDVQGARGSTAIPIFVADGMLVALDDDTLEVFAVGPVSPVLQAGGRAVLGEDATLRGAPSDSAIERAKLTAGTVVIVTGNGEAANGTEWIPVTEQATDVSGWLPASILSGQDGSIIFSPIDVNEFGYFTSFAR